jgi:hypothetical protein
LVPFFVTWPRIRSGEHFDNPAVMATSSKENEGGILPTASKRPGGYEKKWEKR